MKRITPEQANNYVSKSDDLLGLEVKFFTLTPDEQDPRWDNVVYYTGRKKNIYKNQKGEGDSWVYILTNPSMPELLKIGSTKNLPDIRAKQVSRGTGVPLEFIVKFAFKCFNSEGLEREVHKNLKSQRVNTRKEFFKLTVEEAQKIIERIGQKYL
tara:strand:- start:112 stop:576 length:465 start_codon:yes stop_codon:yes gene_type:complete